MTGLDKIPRESKQPLVRIDDGKEFNDPTGWGFCDYCIFMVAVADGRMVVHRRFRNSPDDSLCNGSNRDPLADVPYSAEPRQRVSVYKDAHRGRSRAHYQRMRQLARDNRADLEPAVIIGPRQPLDLSPFIGPLGRLDLRMEAESVEHNDD